MSIVSIKTPTFSTLAYNFLAELKNILEFGDVNEDINISLTNQALTIFLQDNEEITISLNQGHLLYQTPEKTDSFYHRTDAETFVNKSNITLFEAILSDLEKYDIEIQV